jgi:hypothetical protein
MAAVEAAEALEHARDPAVRRVLSKIAEDEKRHAELAWRYVHWAISQDAALRAAAASAFASVVAECGAATGFDRAAAGAVDAPSGSTPEDENATGDELLPFGVVPDRLRRAIHVSVLRSIVAPCAAAVLASSPDPRAKPVLEFGKHPYA